MRRAPVLLLSITAIVLTAAGCSGEGEDDDNPYCYATDAGGVVRDSVRPDTGFVCVASLRVTSPVADSVRPDTGGASIDLHTARRRDLH